MLELLIASNAPKASNVSHPFFERHRATLERAVAAIADRGYWTPFPESPSPKVYGDGAAEAGKAAFDRLANKRFPLSQPATIALR